MREVRPPRALKITKRRFTTSRSPKIIQAARPRPQRSAASCARRQHQQRHQDGQRQRSRSWPSPPRSPARSAMPFEMPTMSRAPARTAGFRSRSVAGIVVIQKSIVRLSYDWGATDRVRAAHAPAPPPPPCRDRRVTAAHGMSTLPLPPGRPSSLCRVHGHVAAAATLTATTRRLEGRGIRFAASGDLRPGPHTGTPAEVRHCPAREPCPSVVATSSLCGAGRPRPLRTICSAGRFSASQVTRWEPASVTRRRLTGRCWRTTGFGGWS